MKCSNDACPALALPGRKVCAAHDIADTAQRLGLSHSYKCGECRKRFNPTDYVLKQRNRREQYVHARCEPKKPTKREQRDAPKPLIDGP